MGDEGFIRFAFDKFVLAPKREAALVATSVGTTQEKVSAEINTTSSDKSIAVLPFVDMSKAKDQEYFSDGLAETTLDMLSRVPDLKVISRTSSFAFKGKAMDVREIGRKLVVDPMLEKLRQQPCFEKQFGRIRAQAETQVSAARKAGLL